MRQEVRTILQALLLLTLFHSFAALATTPDLTWEEAKLRARQVASVDYRLYFRFTGGSREYQGKAEVMFNLKAVPDHLFLDFSGDRLKKLRINGHPVARAAIQNHRVYLKPELLKTGRNTVQLVYANDFDTGGTGLHRFVDPVDNREYFFSHFEPFWANRLFPCFDQPDLKASFSVTVDAPDDWQIISNTLATKTGNGDLSRHEFARSRRFSTYLFALVGGPFAVFEDRRARIPSRLFSTQSMSAYVDAENIFEVTRQGFDFYGKYFGIPYPFGKYDQIFVPHFNAGAMENVAAVVIKEDAYLYRETPLPSRMQKRANTILHEMAHMWFGDIVTMRWWNDLWLNESFATFMSYLAQVEGTPDKHAWQQFSSSMKNWAYWQDQLPNTHPSETRVEDTLSTFDNFDGITYGKGASVLKQLAFYVGSEAFRKGVSSYLKKHAWKNAERKDFTDAIGQAAGMNLDGWTKLWLQKSGINTLVADYEVDAQGRISRFELLQGKGNGDGVLRPHRLQVALFHDREGKPGLEKTVTVNVTGERTAVDDLVGEPAPDFVYPNYGDHAYAKFYLDDCSIAYARRHLDLLPASVRPGIWSTLWFMVQDGRLSPSAYMAIFLDMAPRENDARQVSSFRWKLNTLLDQYLNQAEWRDAMERLHAIAWQQLNAGKPGSDLQVAWLEYLLRSSASAAAGNRLAGMLSGKVIVPGLELGQDRRWQILIRLAAMGYPGTERLLATEEQRDPGERGKRQAFMARAAMPDAAMKEKIWRKLLHDRSLSLTHAKAALAQFYQRSQLDLTRRYVKRYFKVLPSVLKERDDLFARTFVEEAYPAMYVEKSVLGQTGKMMEGNDAAPEFYRRLLTEAEDAMARSLRIRQLKAQY